MPATDPLWGQGKTILIRSVINMIYHYGCTLAEYLWSDEGWHPWPSRKGLNKNSNWQTVAENYLRKKDEDHVAFKAKFGGDESIKY